MWLIRDNRNGVVYRSISDIRMDRVSSLYKYPFLLCHMLSEEEYESGMYCIDKWDFIEVIDEVDGRFRINRVYDVFSWNIVFQNRSV